MQSTERYHSEKTTTFLGGKMITVENLTPILPPKERERRRRETEKQLFNVFVKYTDKQSK